MSDYRREREAIRWIVDDELYKLLSTIRACIAGGCITSIFTGQPIADIDIFFRDQVSYDRAVRYFGMCERNKYRGTRAVCETDKAKTFAMTHNKKYYPDVANYGLTFFRKDANQTEVVIQLVRHDVNCGEPEDIVNRFDITACQAAFDFKTDNFVLGSRFLQDNARRRVVINPECKNVIGAFFRMQKYIEKGYTVSPREYLKAAFMLADKKYKTYREFVDDLKLSFQDPLIHHFYNKVRYPVGIRCAEKDSMMDNPFDASVIVEWIEEFNVAGPHYPVKEGKDLTEEVNKDYSAPKVDEHGDVIEIGRQIDNFFDSLDQGPAVAMNKHPLFNKTNPASSMTPKAVAHQPKNPFDDDEDIDLDGLAVECVKEKKEYEE